MALIDQMRRQKLYYWKKNGTDVDGNPTYGPVVILKCRWENKDQTFLEQRRENKAVSNAQVFFKDPPVLGSAVKKVDDADVKAKLTDAELKDKLTSLTLPFENDLTWEIRQIGDQPNIRATKFLNWGLL